MKENNPVKVLVDEHDVISGAEILVGKLNKLWETNAEDYKARLENLLEFFALYSDQFHHHKEEEVLFRHMLDHPEFKLDGIITELESHHESFRESVKEIRNALNAGEWAEAHRILEHYMDHLLMHIAVENDELFPMAENLFNKDELEKMYFLFEDIDRDLGYEKKKELAGRVSKMLRES
jgi:hemerythrin-like domain-containing protein